MARKVTVLFIVAALMFAAYFAGATFGYHFFPDDRPYATIFVRRDNPAILPEFEPNMSDSQFERFVRNLALRVKSPMVLAAVVRAFGPNESVSVEFEDLRRHLEVKIVDEQFIRIYYNTPDREHAVKIINAVVEAYFDEEVSKFKDEEHERRTELDKVYQRVNEKLRSTRRAMQELASSVEAGNAAHGGKLLNDAKATYLRKLNTKYAELRLQILENKSETGEEAEATPEITRLTVQLEGVTDELETLERERHNAGLYAAQIEELAAEAEKNEELARKLAHMIEGIMINFQSRPRVERYQSAE